ncbi:MAG: AroM family protein [Chloroflexi bacterium]|nr:AroM family protein [Chloroflexota bacterium]MDA8217030.1 AroM family protein [Dehalococcoidales bacterium]
MAKSKRRIGAITIGQSPRDDVVPEMLEVLGGEVEFVQAGALDELAREQIAGLAPRPGDYVLVTRLHDGSSVQVAEHHILPRMQAQIDRVVAAGAEAVALLCTGEFPPLDCPRLLIKPQVVLYHFVAGIAEGKRLGVVIPAREQMEETGRRWGTLGGALRVEAGSPYADISQLEAAVASLKSWEADLIVLDCIGFTRAMKARAAELAGVPVVLPRTVLARTLAELV